MGAADRHRAISQRNERFFEAIGGPEAKWSDWAMTVLFYAAVHDLTALALDRGLPTPEKHGDMKKVLRSEGWDHLAKSYAVLLSRSWRARYKGGLFMQSHLEESRQVLHQLRVDIAELPDQPVNANATD